MTSALTMSHFLVIFGGLAALLWAAVLLPPLARAAATGTGSAIVVPALYLAGIGGAVTVFLDPDFEHGVLPVSNAAHDHASQAVYTGTFLLAGIALLGAFQSGSQWRAQARTWIVGLVGFGFAINVAALATGHWNFRLLQLPAMLFVVTRGRDLPTHVVLRHLRYILRFITLGSLVLLLTSESTVILDIQGRRLLGWPQLAGLTAHPNVLGPMAALALAVELVPAPGSRLRRRSRVGIAGAIAACALAQSRAGWLAAALVVVVLVYRRLGAFSRIIILGAFGVLTILLVAKSPDLAVSLNGRAAIWREALQVFRANPVFGGGPEALSDQVQIGAVSTAGAQAHNQFLEAMAITGLFGLSMLALFVGGALRAAFRTRAPVATAAVFVIMLDMLFESPINAGHLLVLAAVALLASQDRDADEATAEPAEIGAALPQQLPVRSGALAASA